MKNRFFSGVALLLLTGFTHRAQAQELHWQPFGRAAFEQAEKENKLVLLDLVASWCHWCHVMEETTYANPEVKKFLSDHFVLTRADQDKSPDLYARYREYGWPATIIFDARAAELAKESGYMSVPEFLAVLREISDADPLPEPFAADNTTGESDTLAYAQLTAKLFSFLDVETGGFALSQKYVEYDTYDYALRHSRENGILAQWLQRSIENSAGINDTAWGGVYQYSTRNGWNYPHFEKLLRIQARYIHMYARYARAFGDSLILQRALRIRAYADAFLSGSGELYYNSQNADLFDGQHAGTYFSLSASERMKQGIPRIDSVCYARENAQFAEALVYLGAATGDTAHWGKADRMLQELMRHYRLADGGYTHGLPYSGTVTLADQLAVCKAMETLYRATGRMDYFTEMMRLTDYIRHTFATPSGGYVNYRSQSNPLPPHPVISENIDLCRLLNRLSYVSEEEGMKAEALRIYTFLTTPAVLQEMVSEAGLLAAYEELHSEPLKLVLFIQPGEKREWNLVLAGLWSAFSDYVVIEWYSGPSVPENVRLMYEASGGQTCAFVCTSRTCSSPFFTPDQLSKIAP